MSFYDFIYNLQRRPYQTRKKVLAGLLVFSFLILAVFWVVAFKGQVSGGLNTSEKSASSNILGENEKLLSPAAALIDGFKGFKNDIIKKVGEYKESLNTADNESVRPIYELPVE